MLMRQSNFRGVVLELNSPRPKYRLLGYTVPFKWVAVCLSQGLFRPAPSYVVWLLGVWTNSEYSFTLMYEKEAADAARGACDNTVHACFWAASLSAATHRP